MPRVVRDADAREWVVSARPHLGDPEARVQSVTTSDAVLRGLVLTVAGVLVVAVLLSTPANLWFPGWLAAPLVLAGAIALVWWLLGRVWTLTAVPDGHHGDGGVEDVRVRGPWAARQAHGRLVRHVASRTAPAPHHGPTPHQGFGPGPGPDEHRRD